ncbi:MULTISPECIES: hypothetical protein [unclassified Psychrobacter]|uniref:hypothetical protein n=1 Tax=unclassified Psychrobacter TaxID=196806 RepID=UPI001868851F|nr:MULTISPECIES: hypothetical protein [unclassified Psychrobacter]
MKIPDLNDLIADLQTAKQIAIADRNPNGIVTATMSQAKLLGFDKPVIKDVNADAVQSISELMNELSSEQAAITYKNIMG